MDFIKVSWEKLYTDCITLSKKAQEGKADEIIAISRGGVVMGRLLSDFLSLPMSNISMQSYIGTMQTKEPEIVAGLTKDITGKTILLVDDVADTGKTFKKAVPYLESLGAKKVYAVAPYLKPHAIFSPDFWVEKTASWIVFPYEVWEVQGEMGKMLGGEHKAREKLLELGAEDWELIR
ncbi:MAG: hypothetical protein KGJ07_04550 [Patescibacteria group bacterium]|nr:hypothetical protein [Patescibacteria group bacterium]MDE2590781.1 hypothetical protein [Patescibacteria group bacterium]